MKTEYAKKLIERVIDNHLYGTSGVGQKPKHLCSDLEDLIDANRIMTNLKNDTQPNSDKTSYVNVAERVIAATYVAMEFDGGSPGEPTIAGYANGNYVIVISEEYFKLNQ